MTPSSMSSSAESTPRLKLIKVEEISPTAKAQPAAAMPSAGSGSAFLTQLMAVMGAIALILSARLILLLAGSGAFALAFIAVQAPDGFKIATCIVYDIGVILPLAYIDLRSAQNDRG